MFSCGFIIYKYIIYYVYIIFGDTYSDYFSEVLRKIDNQKCANNTYIILKKKIKKLIIKQCYKNTLKFESFIYFDIYF